MFDNRNLTDKLSIISYLDGVVDVRELARLFVYDPRACEKFVKKVIQSVDIDNSGNLSFAEFLMLMVKTEGVEGVKSAFQSYDTGEVFSLIIPYVT